MNRLVSILVVWVTLVLAGCASQRAAQRTTTDDAAAVVRGARESYVAALASGDAHRVAGLLADAAAVMLPNQPELVGRDAVERYYEAIFASYTMVVSIASVESKTFGDRALDRGTYAMRLTPKAGGDPILDEGKYLYLMQRQADGTWQVTHDISNTSLPMPGASP